MVDSHSTGASSLGSSSGSGVQYINGKEKDGPPDVGVVTELGAPNAEGRAHCWSSFGVGANPLSYTTQLSTWRIG